jgi:YegS/Rv2252/BmrU family lipid kinase
MAGTATHSTPVDRGKAHPTTSTLVIWNPGAGGTDDVEATRASIRGALAAHGVDAELFESPSEDATARRIDEALADGVDRIVAAGGDGTVRSIAFRLLGTNAALGILPLGTAMNVARTLDIPLDLDGAAAILASGSVRSIDVGLVGEQPFLEVATIGLAADMQADATRVKEGRLRSAVDLLVRAIRHRRTRIWLQLDDRPEIRHRAISVAIANGRFSGRGMEVAPDAHIDDGRLDIVCFLGFGPLEVLKELVRVTFGVGSGATTASYRAARIGIRSHHPLPVRADSNDIGTTPVEIGTRPGALRVVRP